MALPPLWKIRREILRVIRKGRVKVLRLSSGDKTISYKGLSVPMERVGMNADIIQSMQDDSYEDPEIRGLQSAVRNGDRVLELGSGLGVVTALAGRAAAPTGHVLSFEANPTMIPETRAFLAAHAITNVDLRHAVLVPKAAPGETRDFHLTGSFSSSSLLNSDTRKDRGMISVPTAQLNDVVAEFKPDVLVCDIEGGEAELIPALDASHLKAVVMELHPDRLSQEQLDEIDAALASFGLRPNPAPLGGTVVLYERGPT